MVIVVICLHIIAKMGKTKKAYTQSDSAGVSIRDRPKFGFGYGVSAETTQKYGFCLVSVTVKRNGRITVSDKT